MERIICPFHAESTPSLVIYEDGYKCYGCGAYGSLPELGREANATPRERYKESLGETRKYIDGLPKKVIRGFNLPYDDNGYYLVWSDSPYYKRRNWLDSGSKYKNPSGHTQPLFWARRKLS